MEDTTIINRGFNLLIRLNLLIFMALFFCLNPLTVSNVYGADATLTWTAPGDDGNSGQADRYDIRYATFLITDANWGSCTVVPNPPAPSIAGEQETFIVTGLNSSTTYYFAIKTADEADNWSGLSNVFDVTTEDEAVSPIAVADFSIGANSPNSITLNWTAPGDDSSTGTASQYEIRYSTSSIDNGNFSSATLVSGVPAPQVAGSQESFEVTGLATNTTYYFAIKTADEIPNWSDISNVVSGSTGLENIAPLAATDFDAINPTSNSITLTWTASGDDNSTGTASEYDIRYSTSSITDANWSSAIQLSDEPSPQVAGSSEQLVVSGLNPSTTYYFALKIADEVPNWSGLSNIASNITSVEQTAPSIVADLITLSPTDSSITLSWTAPGDDGNIGTASVYDIRYSTATINDANWDQAVQIQNEPVPLVAGSQQSYTVYGLDTNTTYYFVIKTADEVPNWSGISAVVIRATLRDETPPSPIIDLQATVGSTGGSIDLSWTPPEGFDFTDNFGGLASPSILASDAYLIKYSNQMITEQNWDSLLFFSDSDVSIDDLTPSSATISGLEPGMVYYVAMKVMDSDSNLSELSNVVWSEAKVNILTDIDEDYNELPEEFVLSQNYPNPFNPLTTIQFSLATQSQVSLVVYDVNGKQVASLVNETKKAGRHTITFDGSHLTSGIYFYNLHYKEGVLTRKMTLVK